MPESADIYLAEFKALRDELLAIRQIQTAVYTAALTILAGVGTFALSRKDGRVATLLVLPFVLSGLGVVVVQCAIGIRNVGTYTRECLWMRLPAAVAGASWEHFLLQLRNRSRAESAATVIVPILILVVPSLAVLGINHRQAVSALWPLWWGGLVALALFGGIAARLHQSSKHPAESTI